MIIQRIRSDRLHFSRNLYFGIRQRLRVKNWSLNGCIVGLLSKLWFVHHWVNSIFDFFFHWLSLLGSCVVCEVYTWGIGFAIIGVALRIVFFILFSFLWRLVAIKLLFLNVFFFYLWGILILDNWFLFLLVNTGKAKVIFNRL